MINMNEELKVKTIKDFKKGNVSLERTLLVLSGLNDERDLQEYVSKLDLLQKQFISWFWENADKYVSTGIESKLIKRANALFDFLQEGKSKRFTTDYYRLTDVIDAQLSEDDKEVGCCLGLTSLYTVLCQKNEIDILIGKKINHVFNLIKKNCFEVCIENISKEGFDDFVEDYRICSDEILVYSFYISRGNAKKSKGDFDGAFKEFQDALNFYPTDVTAHVCLGILSFDLENFDEAIHYFDEAIEVDPKAAVAYLCRGNIKSFLGNYHGAIEDFDEVIQVSPYSQIGVDALVSRGKSKQNLGILDESLNDFNEALFLNCRDVNAYICRGKLKECLGVCEDAIKDYDEAEKIDPSRKEIYCFRGDAKMRLGRKVEAKIDYDKHLNFVFQTLEKSF